MKAARLVCKGCSAVYPLEALFACDRCFGPLEVGYDDVDAPIAREAVESGPPTLWRRRERGSPVRRRVDAVRAVDEERKPPARLPVRLGGAHERAVAPGEQGKKL